MAEAWKRRVLHESKVLGFDPNEKGSIFGAVPVFPSTSSARKPQPTQIAIPRPPGSAGPFADPGIHGQAADLESVPMANDHHPVGKKRVGPKPAEGVAAGLATQLVDTKASRRRFAPHFAPAHDFLFHISDETNSLPKDPPPLLKKWMFDTILSSRRKYQNLAAIHHQHSGSGGGKSQSSLPPIDVGGSQRGEETFPAEQNSAQPFLLPQPPNRRFVTNARPHDAIPPLGAIDPLKRDPTSAAIDTPLAVLPNTSQVGRPVSSSSARSRCSSSSAFSSTSRSESRTRSSSRSPSVNSRRRPDEYVTEERVRHLEAALERESKERQEVLEKMKHLEQVLESHLSKATNRRIWKGHGKVMTRHR
jgi:hypothetical protein